MVYIFNFLQFIILFQNSLSPSQNGSSLGIFPKSNHLFYTRQWKWLAFVMTAIFLSSLLPPPPLHSNHLRSVNVMACINWKLFITYLNTASSSGVYLGFPLPCFPWGLELSSARFKRATPLEIEGPSLLAVPTDLLPDDCIFLISSPLQKVKISNFSTFWLPVASLLLCKKAHAYTSEQKHPLEWHL